MWDNGKMKNGKIYYRNSTCFYEGEFSLKTGKFEGIGSMHLDNIMHKGNFKNGKLNGEGARQGYGIKEKGFYVNGELNGPNCELDVPRGVYKGECKDGKPHGQGVLLYDTGEIHTGLFKVGIPYGQGRYDNSDGDIIDGFFKGNTLNGPGLKKEHTSCQMFKGNFIAGVLNGQGSALLFSDHALTNLKRKTEGEFLNGEPHGRCRIEMYYDKPSAEEQPDAVKGRDFRTYIQIYEGDCVNGFKEGYGSIVFKYLDKIDPSLKDKLIPLNQRKYEGEFRSNMPHGYGTMLYENGTRFIGYFFNGVRQGLGMEIRPFAEEGKQRVVKGMFERNELVGPNWIEIPASVASIDQ